MTEAAPLSIPCVCIDPSSLTREAPAHRVQDSSELATLCATPGWLESLRERLGPEQRGFSGDTYTQIGEAAATEIAACGDALVSAPAQDARAPFATQGA